MAILAVSTWAKIVPLALRLSRVKALPSLRLALDKPGRLGISLQVQVEAVQKPEVMVIVNSLDDSLKLLTSYIAEPVRLYSILF
jgi:hypothetical protein